MDRKSKADRGKTMLPLMFLAGFALAMPLELAAQVPVDEYGQPLPALDDGTFAERAQAAEALSDAELQELIGPIALYPDDLLAIVLPASTYPLEIVQAARFLDELRTDSSLEPDESWDESVVALLNYPEVVYMMDEKIDWTWRLGEAVINQQSDVLAAVDEFRDRAYAAGNLESDERQTVSNEDGYIEIEPADEEIIYVPYYEPEEVVVYQPRRVYHYYPYAYPVYYYPYPVGYSFASGYFWGVTTAFTIGWRNHCVRVHHPSYWGHPYYGRLYHGHYYRRPSIAHFNRWYQHNRRQVTTHHRYRDGDQWRPRQRSGSRPATRTARHHFDRSSDRNGHRIDVRSDDTVRQQVRNRDRVRTEADRSRRAVSNRPVQRTAQDRARSSRDAGNSASRQRLTTGNTRENVFNGRVRQDRETNRRSQRQVTTRTTRPPSRQVISNSRAEQSRRPVQRSVPPRTTRDTRTSSRQATRRQAVAAQRPAARPSSQRQAAPQRATRQREAPARTATPARQSRRAAAPSSRSQIRTRRHRD